MLRRVNWKDFETGGHEGRSSVKFKPPKVPDRRDNREEALISNATASRIRAEKENAERFSRLSPEEQAALLLLLNSPIA